MDKIALLYILAAAAEMPKDPLASGIGKLLAKKPMAPKVAKVLSTADREAIPKSEFAMPSKASTPQGKAEGGSYPIPDLAHARNALARCSGKPVEAAVRAKVYARYPELRGGSGK